jgi:membrane-bound serine protease (ClpP class)
MRRFLPLLLLALLAPVQASAAEDAGEPTVDVVKVDGVIDRSMAEYLTGTLRDAEGDGSQVVIQLDTPGTLNVSALSLADRIAASRVPVVVWVGPPGARAAGAGLLLVYAAGLAVSSPGSGIGPLEPLDLARESVSDSPTIRRTALDRAREWAARTGSDASFASSGRLASAQEVLDEHVVGCAGGEDNSAGGPTCASISIPDLLEKIDGKRVPTAAGAVTLATKSTSARPVLVRFHDLGPGRRVLHAVASPVFIYVLLVLGLAGLAFELTQAGIGVAGIAGAGALALAGYGLAAVPFDPLGLGLLFGGHVAFVLDVRLRRLGAITAAGLAAFVAGSLLLFRQAAPAVDLPLWLVIGGAVAALLYYGFALTVAMKARERVLSRQVGLVGLVGEARGMLAPEGPVFVKGTLWRAKTSDGPIPAGTKVRIRGVDGLILKVEPEDGP